MTTCAVSTVAVIHSSDPPSFFTYNATVGIRLALGARRGQVMQLVLKDAALLVLVGLLLGLVGSLGLGQVVASLLFGISPRNPLHLGAAAITLAAAAAIGSFIPARHASRLDPMNALRDE